MITIIGDLNGKDFRQEFILSGQGNKSKKKNQKKTDST